MSSVAAVFWCYPDIYPGTLGVFLQSYPGTRVATVWRKYLLSDYQYEDLLGHGNCTYHYLSTYSVNLSSVQLFSEQLSRVQLNSEKLSATVYCPSI